jgi:hypothetical protein
MGRNKQRSDEIMGRNPLATSTVNDQQVPYGTPDPQQQWGGQGELQQQYEANQASYQEEMRKRQEIYRNGMGQRAVDRFMDPIMQPFESGYMSRY